MSPSPNLNEPFDTEKNELIDEIGHKYRQCKWIRDKEIEELVIKKYKKNGKGITFVDLQVKFECSKKKAQLRLKNALKYRTDQYGNKNSLLFTMERTKPQQYFASSLKADIIKKKKNRLIDPTGITYKKISNNKFHQEVINKKVQSLSEKLELLRDIEPNLHNIHLQIKINKQYYQDIKGNIYRKNLGIFKECFIANRTVSFVINKNGTVCITIKSNRNPFPFQTEEDILLIYGFMGQVRSELLAILSDPKERIIPPITDWILTECDFSKDLKVNDFEQLTSITLQLKYAGEVFRAYVKSLGNKTVHRFEENIADINKLKEIIRGPSEITELKKSIALLHKKFDERNKNSG